VCRGQRSASTNQESHSISHWQSVLALKTRLRSGFRDKSQLMGFVHSWSGCQKNISDFILPDSRVRDHVFWDFGNLCPCAGGEM
jgi:hypothetical protein